ncbi:MAG: OmpA family protein [Nannocystales bacterium]
MSEEHGHNDGAHEIDNMPAGRLVTILTILGSLTLGLCFGVIQLFNEQVRQIQGERAEGGNASELAYAAEMAAIADGYGQYEIVKPVGEGKPDKVTTRYFMPVGKASQQILDNPALLAGQRPAKDWAGTGTGKKVQEWGGLPSVTPKKPDAKALGDVKKAADKKGPREHRFSFAISGEDLVLLGEVPSEADSKALEGAAKKTRFGDKVRNKLKVTNAPGKPGFDSAYKRALAAVALMSSGNAKFTAGKLSMTGFVPDANKAKFDELSQAAGGPPMGKIEVASTELADDCDKKFAKALKRPIRFGTASADIDEKSMKTLDKLAAIAKECPGRFVVEGHSDNEGMPDANKQLSLQRANAVSASLQEKGVEKKRLRAKGYGQERPLVPNDNDAGRKKNRRIEIHIAR